MRVAIIGAGLAGLACAQALETGGAEVALFDKGRGPGGRMATRRAETSLGPVAFDHGAQYLTARDPGFRAEVQAWADKGLVAPWPAADKDAWVGVPGMNAPVKALAQGRDVRWGVRIEGFERGPDDRGWRLHRAGAPEDETFDALVAAIPAEQAAVLLARAAPDIAQVARATPSQPCWTLMAAFTERLGVASDVVKTEGAVGWAARNSAKPGRAPIEAWVVQASPDWSREHLEEAPEALGSRLLELFFQAAGTEPVSAIHLAAHRWRFARSGRAEREPLWDDRLKIGACGDWMITPRVESAWLSGRHLAAAMLRQDRRPAR